MTMRVSLGSDVGSVEQDGVYYAAALPDGPILVLADEAADVWRAALEGRDVRDNDYVRALVAAELLTIDGDT